MQLTKIVKILTLIACFNLNSAEQAAAYAAEANAQLEEKYSLGTIVVDDSAQNPAERIYKIHFKDFNFPIYILNNLYYSESFVDMEGEIIPLDKVIQYNSETEKDIDLCRKSADDLINKAENKGQIIKAKCYLNKTAEKIGPGGANLKNELENLSFLIFGFRKINLIPILLNSIEVKFDDKQMKFKEAWNLARTPENKIAIIQNTFESLKKEKDKDKLELKLKALKNLISKNYLQHSTKDLTDKIDKLLKELKNDVNFDFSNLDLMKQILNPIPVILYHKIMNVMEAWELAESNADKIVVMESALEFLDKESLNKEYDKNKLETQLTLLNELLSQQTFLPYIKNTLQKEIDKLLKEKTNYLEKKEERSKKKEKEKVEKEEKRTRLINLLEEKIDIRNKAREKEFPDIYIKNLRRRGWPMIGFNCPVEIREQPRPDCF